MQGQLGGRWRSVCRQLLWSRKKAGEGRPESPDYGLYGDKVHVCCQLKHYNTPSVADSLLDYTLQFDIRERRAIYNRPASDSWYNALHNIEKKVAKHVIFFIQNVHFLFINDVINFQSVFLSPHPSAIFIQFSQLVDHCDIHFSLHTPTLRQPVLFSFAFCSDG